MREMEAGSGAAKSRGRKGGLRPAAEEEENPKGRGSVLLARKSGELCGGWFGPRKREIEKCMGGCCYFVPGAERLCGGRQNSQPG